MLYVISFDYSYNYGLLTKDRQFVFLSLSQMTCNNYFALSAPDTEGLLASFMMVWLNLRSRHYPSLDYVWFKALIKQEQL